MEEAAEIAASFCVEEDETKVRRPTDRVCKRAGTEGVYVCDQ